MERFECVVDTTELARSVDLISKNVATTTQAVNEMHNAIVETEKNSADYICANVDRGFYSLIRSQLSSKLADHYSKLNAKFVLLMEYSKTLGNTQNRMEEDVNRIKRDYYKIFHGLDKALENRVYQLDKPAMQLANTRQNLIINKTLKNISTSIYSDQDVTQVSGLALTARMKTRTGIALNNISQDIYENQIFQGSVASSLQIDRVEENQEVCIPVIYSYANSQVVSGTNVSKIYVPDTLDNSLSNSVTSTVESQLTSLLEAPAQETEIVKNAYEEMVAQSGLNSELSSLMIKLFNNGGIK